MHPGLTYGDVDAMTVEEIMDHLVGSEWLGKQGKENAPTPGRGRKGKR